MNRFNNNAATNEHRCRRPRKAQRGSDWSVDPFLYYNNMLISIDTVDDLAKRKEEPGL